MAAAVTGVASVLRSPLPRGRPGRVSVQAFVITLVLACLSSLLVVGGGVLIRLMLALVVGLLLCTMVLLRPGLGVVATFVYLVLVEFLRRVLIDVAPWISADPLLLVGPLVASVLLVKLFVLESRRWAPDVISKLVLLILALSLAEVFNPAGGGIGAGLTGLLFMAVPLLWFFVGRELSDERNVRRLLVLVVALSVPIAVYGLWQVKVGEPHWDRNWLDVTGGYTALNVGNQVRPFGTFASSSEFALFLAAALAIALAFALKGRLIALVPTPLLVVALFLSSARGALVTTAVAIVVLLGLRTGRPAAAAAVTVLAAGAAVAAVHFAGPMISAQGSASSALVSHEVNGITDPLNPNSSTLLIHLQLVVNGVKSGISHPLGQGTAVTNGAAGVIAGKAFTNSQATEVDLSNAFVAFGIGGGLIYVFLVASVLWRGIRRAFTGNPLLLGVLALLLADLGQWQIGGDYALASLAWVMVGVVAAPER
jgi:hypothetical protein